MPKKPVREYPLSPKKAPLSLDEGPVAPNGRAPVLNQPSESAAQQSSASVAKHPSEAAADISKAPNGATPGLPTSLSEISDRKLTAQVKKLSRLERVSTLQILLHLIEIERRELHLAMGYRSMFDYCRFSRHQLDEVSQRRLTTY